MIPAVTAFSCVAYLDRDGKPTIIKAKDGNHTTPSHVAFLRSGRVVGSTAKTDVRCQSLSPVACLRFDFMTGNVVVHPFWVLHQP